MKNLPEEIKIANRIIKVEVVELDPSLFGQYDPNEMVISLNKSNTPVQMLETFWHELVHAINDYNRVQFEIRQELESLSGDTGMDAYNLEERLTENFAMAFLMVLTDNNLIPVLKESSN